MAILVVGVALNDAGSGSGLAFLSSTRTHLVAVVAIRVANEDTASGLRCALLAASTDLVAVVAIDIADDNTCVRSRRWGGKGGGGQSNESEDDGAHVEKGGSMRVDRYWGFWLASFIRPHKVETVMILSYGRSMW